MKIDVSLICEWINEVFQILELIKVEALLLY